MIKILNNLTRLLEQLENLTLIQIFLVFPKIIEFFIRKFSMKNFIMKDIWGVYRIYTHNDPMGFRTCVGGYELEEQAFFSKLLKGKLKNAEGIVDVGSAVGTFSCLFAKFAPNATIYSFEPSPFSYEQQLSQIEANNFSKKIELYNYGIGASSSLMSFYYQDGIEGSLWGSFHNDEADPRMLKKDIKIVSLDDFFDEEQQIDLIKIDIEGAELPALLGMSNTIDRCQPLILCEFALNFLVQQEGDVYLKTLEFFGSKGYKPFLLQNSKILPYTWPQSRVMNLILVPNNFDINKII
tara:strand:+ start:291 stop:1175 length:885 start_codon:yes stop_codon:yes gene_type:complete